MDCQDIQTSLVSTLLYDALAVPHVTSPAPSDAFALAALDSFFHSGYIWPVPMTKVESATPSESASPATSPGSVITTTQWTGPLASLHVDASPAEAGTPPDPTVRSYVTDEEKWTAVLQRDPGATSFFYLVHSTRCYCRPTCPARRPKRKNVGFIPNPPGGGELAALRIRVEMEKKGYKPCKRCLPDQAQTASDRRQEVTVERAKDLIVGCVVEGREVPKLDDLAREVGMSKFYFLRVFRKSTGETPDSYAKSVRKLLRSALDDPTPAK